MLSDKIAHLNPCYEAVNWLDTCSTEKEAWEKCTRGDWMLWLLAKLGCDKKTIVLAACECARLSLEFVPKDEPRPLIAIEKAEAWVKGRANLKQVAAAAAAATYVAAAATDDDAAYAAADAAYAAADVANDAAYAAAAATYVAAAAKHNALAKCANIVRKHFPNGPYDPIPKDKK